MGVYLYSLADIEYSQECNPSFCDFRTAHYKCHGQNRFCTSVHLTANFTEDILRSHLKVDNLRYGLMFDVFLLFGDDAVGNEEVFEVGAFDGF